MFSAIIWKLFLACGMSLDATFDTLEGAAFVVVLLGLGCIAVYHERTHPRESRENGLTLQAIIDLLIKDSERFAAWVERILRRHTPPELWQSNSRGPSLGRITVFLILLPLIVVLSPAIMEVLILRWLLRRSPRD